MFMRSNIAAFAVLLASAAVLPGQTERRSLFKVDLPSDSPVAVISFGMDDSSTSAKGGAMLLDIHSSLTLRNTSSKRIRGITLIVRAQEVTPGGKASISVPSLDVAPGEAFPVRVDLRLLRPLQAGSSAPLVQLGLDGVLFDDLTYMGPNQLKCIRTMMVWEMEARRDRKYLRAVLEKGGPEALRKEILAALAPQPDRAQVGMQMNPAGGRATNLEAERQVEFAFLQFPDSPVQPMEGMAKISGNEASAPRVDIRNKSDRPVKYLEIGWILRDQQGRDFLAGTVPAEINLAPGRRARVSQQGSLKFPDRSAITGMTGFVSSVEFSDGNLWVPSRASLDNPQLRSLLPPSPEEQRLVQIYRKRGLPALIEELKKF